MQEEPQKERRVTPGCQVHCAQEPQDNRVSLHQRAIPQVNRPLTSEREPNLHSLLPARLAAVRPAPIGQESRVLPRGPDRRDSHNLEGLRDEGHQKHRPICAHVHILEF